MPVVTRYNCKNLPTLCMDNQLNLNFKMFEILIDWIYDVLSKFKLNDYSRHIDFKTLFMYACHYVVYILNEKPNVLRREFQLYGVLTIYHVLPHNFKYKNFADMAYITGDAYTPDLVEYTYNKWKLFLDGCHSNMLFHKQNNFGHHGIYLLELEHNISSDKNIFFRLLKNKNKKECIDVMTNPDTYKRLVK